MGRACKASFSINLDKQFFREGTLFRKIRLLLLDYKEGRY